MQNGAVFFSTNTGGINFPFLLPVLDEDENGRHSYRIAALLIFSNGAWHRIGESFPQIEIESKTYPHASDYWPLDDNGQRMGGRVDAELATVALRDASKIAVPYAAGDSLDAWSVITCGGCLANLIWQHAPVDQAVLLFDREGLYQCRYPSRYGKSRAGILDRDRRSKNVSSRLNALARQYDSVEAPLIEEFKSATQPLTAYQGKLPGKVKAVETFVRNTRRRAATKAVSTFSWWLNGYPGDAPSDHEVYVAYVASVEQEVQRARESIVDLTKTTVSRLTKMADAVADLGPLITSGVAKARYKMMNAVLDTGRKNGTLRGTELNGQWHWAQNDIRDAAGVSHLAIQSPDDIPQILDPYNLNHCYSVCCDLAEKFDATCQIDIHVSFCRLHSRALKPVRKHSIRSSSNFLQRYYAHDVIAWIHSDECRKLVAGAQRSADQTAKPKQTTRQMPSAVERPAAKTRAADQLTIMTSSKESHGYHDFLSEVDLSEVSHEVVSLGYREQGILDHLVQRTFKAGDIICIVRGGGDLLHPSFKPFDHFDSAIQLKKLKERGVVVVTGIGHSRDRFVVERGATFVESTPVKAGQRVRELLQAM